MLILVSLCSAGEDHLVKDVFRTMIPKIAFREKISDNVKDNLRYDHRWKTTVRSETLM